MKAGGAAPPLLLDNPWNPAHSKLLIKQLIAWQSGPEPQERSGNMADTYSWLFSQSGRQLSCPSVLDMLGGTKDRMRDRARGYPAATWPGVLEQTLGSHLSEHNP